MSNRIFKAKRIYQKKASTAPEDFYRLDPKKSPKENAYDIYVALTLKDTNDSKRLYLLNEFVTLLQQNKEITLGFTTDELLFCLSASLTHSFTQVRAAALRSIRYVLSTPKDLQIFNALQLQHLVCRSIDFMLKVDDERVQAFKLIRKMLAISPDNISPILVRCLVSMGDFGNEDNDRMLRACLATLCEFGILNPTLLIVCGGVGTITRNILECHSPRISESLCGVLLYLLEHPHTRNIAGIQLDCLAAPYCDFTYRLGIMDKNKDARELRYTSSRLALLSVLKSWTGILEFCDPSRPSGLKAIVDILYLNQLDVRKAILDLLYELIGLPQIIWTDEYSVALSLVDPSDFQDAWLLNNGFVAMEGRCILPSLANRVPNICEQNLAIILYCFLETGLLSALIEVIVSSDTYISVRATILVGKLLHLMHTLLPADICSTCQALPTLISYAAQGNNQANAAINALQNYHQMLKNRPASCSLFLDLIIRSGALINSRLFKRDIGLGEYFNVSGTFEERRKRLDSNASSISADETNSNWDNTSGTLLTRRSSFRMKRIRKISQYFDQIREFDKLVKESRVMIQEDSNKWDWDVVSTMLKSEAMGSKLDDAKIRFLRRLITFYKPTNFKFSHQDLPNGRGVPSVVTAGLDLIDWLLTSKDLESMRLLTDLFSDIKTQLLEISTSNRAHDCLFSPQHMNSTMCQQYFIFIGRMCRTEKGLGVLINNGVFQQLTEIVTNTYHVCYIKLIISGLDYTLPSFARKILELALTASTVVSARLYATQFMLVLLRARLPNFEVWGIPLLIKQTMDKKKSIVIAAMEILDEACHEKDYLEEIIQKWPNLSHLGDMGTLLMSRYYSLSRGLNSPHSKVKKEIEYWKNTFNKRYVLQIEADVHASLTLHIKNEEGFYSRRNCSSKPIIFPPNIQPHLYGQLVQTEQGLGELRKFGGLSNLIETIKKGKCSDENECLELKAALWAIGHCSTHSNGIEFLKDPIFRIYEKITSLASTAEVYSIRAVAFNVLGLVASTSAGATLLFKLDWFSIRHDRNVQWPVYQPEDWNPNHITPIRHQFDEVPPYNYKGIDEQIECFNASSDSNSYFLDEQIESKGSSSKDEQSDGQTTQNALVSSKSRTLPEHASLRNFRHKRSLSESKTSDDVIGLIHTTPHQQTSHRTRFNSGTDSNTSGVSSCESVLGRNIYSDLQQTPLSPIPSTSNLLEVNNLKEYHRFSTDTSFRFFSLSPQDIKGYATLRSIKRHYRPVLSESAADDIADIIDLNEIMRPARQSFSDYQRKVKIRSLDRQSSTPLTLPLTLDEYQVPLPSLTTPKIFSQADSKGPIYAGITLPKNIMDLFPHRTPHKTYISQDIQDQDFMDINLLTAKQEYLNDSLNAAGTSVMSSLSDVSSVSKHKPTKWVGKHSRGNCLQCSRLRFNRNASEISILRSSIQLSDLSFNSPESILSDDNMPDRVSAQILQGVQRLANPVCGKQAQTLLLELKQKHSTSFQDICLYSEVSKTLGRSTFRMPARRFIQELFMDLSFDSFYLEPSEILQRKDKDTMSSACSNDEDSRDLVDGADDLSSTITVTPHAFPATFKSHIKSPPLESVYETSYENLMDSLPKTNSLTSSSTTTTTTKANSLYRNQIAVNNSSDSSIIVVDENKRNSSSASLMENENKHYTRGRFYTLELDLSCTKNKFPITERRKREFSSPTTTSTPAVTPTTTSTSSSSSTTQFTFTKSLSSSLAKPIGSLYCEKRLQSSKSEAVLSKTKSN